MARWLGGWVGWVAGWLGGQVRLYNHKVASLRVAPLGQVWQQKEKELDYLFQVLFKKLRSTNMDKIYHGNCRRANRL